MLPPEILKYWLSSSALVLTLKQWIWIKREVILSIENPLKYSIVFSILLCCLMFMGRNPFHSFILTQTSDTNEIRVENIYNMFICTKN